MSPLDEVYFTKYLKEILSTDSIFICIDVQVKAMARDLYDDHFKAVESMPRGVVVTLRNIATQLESAWELHTNRQVEQHLFWCISNVPTAGPSP